MYAPNPLASTMTRHGHSGILPASRSTSAGSMVRKSGNVTNAPRSMRCNRTGKLIQRPVVLENTNVTVEPSSPGKINIHILYVCLIVTV